MSDLPWPPTLPLRWAGFACVGAAAAVLLTLAGDAVFRPGGTRGDLAWGWAIAAGNAAATVVQHRKAMSAADRAFVRAAIGAALLRIVALIGILCVYRWMRGLWPARLWLALGTWYLVFLGLEIARLHRLPVPRARPPA